MTIALLSLCLVAPPPELPLLPPPGGVEVAPAPRAAAPPFAITPVKGGYQVALNKTTAELLRDALDRVDEKQLAPTLKKFIKDRQEADPDDQLAASLEMVAIAVSTQLPGFKKELPKEIGPNGVIITLTGLQTATVKFRQPRPRLARAAEVVRGVMPLLPDEAREAIEAMRAVARTQVMFWKIEPRE